MAATVPKGKPSVAPVSRYQARHGGSGLRIRLILQALREVGGQFLRGRDRAFHPRVVEDLVESVSLARLVLHHADEEVLELVREIGNLLVDLPEEARLLGGDQVEARIGRVSLFERLASRDEHEEDDARSEQVSFLAVIPFHQELLGRHVTNRAGDALENILLLDARSVTEVSDAQLELLVEEQVLRLEVEMCDAGLFVEVLETAEQLAEVVAGNGLRKVARVGDNVKHFTVLGDVHQHVEDVRLGGLNAAAGDGPAASELDWENVLVLEVLRNAGLLFESGKCLLGVLTFEYLAGANLTGFEVFDEFNLGKCAGAQIFDNLVFLINHSVI